MDVQMGLYIIAIVVVIGKAFLDNILETDLTIVVDNVIFDVGSPHLLQEVSYKQKYEGCYCSNRLQKCLLHLFFCTIFITLARSAHIRIQPAKVRTLLIITKEMSVKS